MIVSPVNWRSDVPTPGAGETLFIARTTVNPATQSGNITPTWSTPVRGGRRWSRRPRWPRRTSEVLTAAMGLMEMVTLGLPVSLARPAMPVPLGLPVPLGHLALPGHKVLMVKTVPTALMALMG